MLVVRNDDQECIDASFHPTHSQPVPTNGDASSSAPPPGVVPIFGAEYNFSLESVVDCPEYLVHFGTFKKMAEKHGMKLVYAKRFPDYAKQVRWQGFV